MKKNKQNILKKTFKELPKIPKWSYPVVFTMAMGTAFVNDEINNSTIQSEIFNTAAQKSSHVVTTDLKSPLVTSPDGPYDRRLGYTKRLKIRGSLDKNGYQLVSQATGNNAKFYDRLSLFPIYKEKNQSGVRLTDASDNLVYQSEFPRISYQTRSDIPEILVKSLCFVENRELCEENSSTKNPSIEWGRFAFALYGQVLKKIGISNDGSGGSTLATQLEKVRHSKGGITRSGEEKLRQMATASVKAYQHGVDTTEEQDRIVVDYINTMPLAAFRGFGEIVGFSDGMALWFGADLDDVNKLLSQDQTGLSEEKLRPIARAYRQALTLIMAVKQPSEYLIRNRSAMQERIDGFLTILGRDGIISNDLMRLAREEVPEFATSVNPKMYQNKQPKSVNTIRAQFMSSLGFRYLQQAELLDISGKTTIDIDMAQKVENLLHEFKNPQSDAAKPLLGHRMSTVKNGASIDYAFTLYQTTPDANLLKVQVDTFKGQFNLNKDAKLELGSTAKLRTLVTYLEVIEEIYHQYKVDVRNLDPYDDFAEFDLGEKYRSQGRLASWVYDFMTTEEPVNQVNEIDDLSVIWLGNYDHGYSLRPVQPEKTLEDILEGAMLRQYSGSNRERFFTGGSFHRFHNYKGSDNYRILTVREALKRSVNLPFIRIMRDIVDYTLYHDMEIDADIFTNLESTQRLEYLDKFIEQESRLFLWRYLKPLRDKSPEEIAQYLGDRTYKSPAHLTLVYRTVFPDAPYFEVEDFIKKNCVNCPEDKNYNEEYEQYGPDKFNLNDQAYITGLHEIQLWLASYLSTTPDANWNKVKEDSKEIRSQSYKWLRRSRNIWGQNKRIKTTIEKEAFDTYIFPRWKKQGFPFNHMVPSYASSIGVSGDNPNSLADLAGIILNDGKKKPESIFSDIHFGKNTPYEDNFIDKAKPSKQVLSREVAHLVHEEMKNVVNAGTARRAKNAVILSDGTKLSIGGKTGTGDNRRKTKLKYGGTKSVSVNRTASFIFTIGECYYGSIIAYASKETANEQRFTSSLPVQAFKEIVPTLTPLFERNCKSPKIQKIGNYTVTMKDKNLKPKV